MVEESRERLLKKNVYYENCPGCKVELYKESQRGLPIRDLFFVWIIVLSNALPISSLFPFLYFMVKDFHIAKREEDISFYSGFIGAAFMLGRACTSVFWGLVADRYGRKPVIILGTIAVVIFNTLFGLSVNYWMAIITRFLLGCLNGVLGPIKAYAVEVFRTEYQALGVSTVSTAIGIGLIVGPAVGGYLAQPADKFPEIFSKNSLFGRFPYFLPCLCISLMAFGVTIASIWLPETLHKHNDSVEALETTAKKTDQKTEVEKTPKKNLLRNWPLMSSILTYCVFSLHSMAYTEIFSLWATSPRKLWGLSYKSEDVGQILTISGCSLFVFQSFLYPYIEKMIGATMAARISGVLTIPLLTAYPYIALLSGFSLFFLLNVASIIKNVLSTAIITGLLLIQSRAVEQNQRGAANGIAMTLMSLFKAVGPAAGGAILSWAQTRLDASFLPGTHMVFFLLNVVDAIGVLMTFKPFLPTP
nr:protein ZINC INDUCED FACILITATOR-LIKE 1-like isoform X7 [Ziziphus jujuba var. spinosa]